MEIKVKDSDCFSQEAQTLVGQSMGNSGWSSPKAGRQLFQKPWGSASGPWCRCPAQHFLAVIAPQKNGAMQGTWPLIHYSSQLLNEAVFIEAVFLGTNNFEARFEVDF